MTLRYFLSCFKKNPGSILFPLVYMIPLFLLVMVNIIRSAGDVYQQYCFYENSNFTYIMESGDEEDLAFLRNSASLNGHYSEELSAPGRDYYGTSSVGNMYFTDNAQLLETSYFTRENLISGELPDQENFRKARELDAFPVCISYNVAAESKSGVGEFLHTIYDDDKIRLYIVGILHPDIDSSCCVLLDENTLHNMTLSGAPAYVTFSDEVPDDGASISLKELKTAILSELTNMENCVSYALALIISGVLCVITNWLLKNRISVDMEVLRKIGLRRYKVSIIHFLRSFFTLLVSLLISVLLIRLIYLPYVAREYYDFTFFVIIFMILLIPGGLVCFIGGSFALSKKLTRKF